MKYIKQFMIILLVTLVADLLKNALPLPIPNSVYGIVIMLSLLNFNIIKLDQVEDVAQLLLSLLPLMFVPITSGIVDNLQALTQVLIPMIIIFIIGNPFVFAVTGWVSQFIVKKKEGVQ